ncbi:MAG: PH domain-containing protein [Lachnospiraceae bacterium]|nr:PH domain-containing protein [Lachnospiraceae bacterium]
MAKLKAGTFNAEIAEEQVLWRDKKRVLFFGPPWSFTSYEITEKKLRISKGFFKKTEDDIMLYRISDITFFQTLGERMNKLGTLCVLSSDTSSPETHLIHIKNARKVKELLMQKVEEARKSSGVYTSEIVGAPRPNPAPDHTPEPPVDGAHK